MREKKARDADTCEAGNEKRDNTPKGGTGQHAGAQGREPRKENPPGKCCNRTSHTVCEWTRRESRPRESRLDLDRARDGRFLRLLQQAKHFPLSSRPLIAQIERLGGKRCSAVTAGCPDLRFAAARAGIGT